MILSSHFYYPQNIPNFATLNDECACGVIGSHARLRIWCREACRFESYQAHSAIQSQKVQPGIFFCNRPNRFTWRTIRQIIFRNIFCHHTFRSDYCITPYLNPTANNHVESNPNIISYMNLLCISHGNSFSRN